MNGIALDTGGLIAFDRDDRRVIVLLARAAERRMQVSIAATALAQAIRDPARQVRLSRLIRQPTTDVVPLDGPDAIGVGRLLAASATRDIVDAHVVLCARRAGHTVVTSAPANLRRLDAALSVIGL